MLLHERLKTEIALYGLRHIDVARRAGVDKGQLSRILSGIEKPPPATIAKIVLAIHGDYLTVARPPVAAS